MTRVGELTGDRIELNPEAPFPPFPIWLRVPAEWSRLDTNPGTWARSAQDLVDLSFHGSKLPAKDKRSALAVVEDLVVDCQRAGTAVSLLTMGRTENGEVASFGIHLAFVSDEHPASLGRIHDSLPRTGTVTELTTTAGPAVVHRDRMTMMVPGTATIKALTSIQIWVPVPETAWTILLSTASAFPDLTDSLEQVLRTVASSIRLAEPIDAGDTAGDTPGPLADAGHHPAGEVPDPGMGPDDTDPHFEPTPRPTGPGIERGFRTFVVRRVGDKEPPPDHEPAARGDHDHQDNHADRDNHDNHDDHDERLAGTS